LKRNDNNFKVITERKFYKVHFSKETMDNSYIRLVPREVREADWPEARFLSEENQAKYEEAIKQFEGNAYNSLNVPINGSNLWKVLFLNQIGIRTATIPELEDALDNGMNLRRYYEDGREVILRSRNDSCKNNNYLSEKLAKDLKLKSFKHPYIIKGLTIKQSEVSENENPYGLEFVVDDAEVIEAPDFSRDGNFKRVNPDYTIEFDNCAVRKHYLRKDGLSRLLYLDDALDLNSYGDHLANLNSHGRVVEISAEGTRKNFLNDMESYKSKFEAERQEYHANLKALRDKIDLELNK
jgi:hypothetical protein